MSDGHIPSDPAMRLEQGGAMTPEERALHVCVKHGAPQLVGFIEAAIAEAEAAARAKALADALEAVRKLRPGWRPDLDGDTVFEANIVESCMNEIRALSTTAPDTPPSTRDSNEGPTPSKAEAAAYARALSEIAGKADSEGWHRGHEVGYRKGQEEMRERAGKAVHAAHEVHGHQIEGWDCIYEECEKAIAALPIDPAGASPSTRDNMTDAAVRTKALREAEDLVRNGGPGVFGNARLADLIHELSTASRAKPNPNHGAFRRAKGVLKFDVAAAGDATPDGPEPGDGRGENDAASVVSAGTPALEPMPATSTHGQRCSPGAPQDHLASSRNTPSTARAGDATPDGPESGAGSGERSRPAPLPRVSDERLAKRIEVHSVKRWATAGIDQDIALDLRDARAELAAFRIATMSNNAQDATALVKMLRAAAPSRPTREEVERLLVAFVCARSEGTAEEYFATRAALLEAACGPLAEQPEGEK